MKLEEIANEAAKLTEEERATLASRLLHDLDTPVYDVSDEELKDRIKEAESDPNIMISFEELVSGLKNRGHYTKVWVLRHNRRRSDFGTRRF